MQCHLLAVMELQGEGNVSAKNCGKVIQIMSSNLFGVELKEKDLPSKNTALNIADEAHHIAKKHIGEEIKNCQHYTFASDGTSRQKKHYMERHIYLQNGKMLSMGFKEIASDDANTLLEQTIDVLEKINEIYCSSDRSAKENAFKESLEKMKCLMSDRAANMKLFDKKLHEFKKATLQDDVSTHFLFCNAHFLLGVATASEEAAKEMEKQCGKLGRDNFKEYFSFQGASESAAQRLIRMATEVFGPRGDEKSGCRQEWLAYCDSKGIISKFSSFRGNRFNNVFENAEAVINHKQHIKDFLSNYATSKNKKLCSIEKDIDDANLISIVGAIALFSSLLTTPYWLLMNSSQSYGCFPPYVKALDEVLLMWEKANHFDELKCPEVFHQFYKPAPSSSGFVKSSECQTDIALKSFKEICNKTSVVLKRQLSDFLGDGIFSNEISSEVKAILDTCPLTNLSGERLFGDLDHHMKKTPHSSTYHRSTINMWKHNRVASWLRKKSKSEKTRILAETLRNRKYLRQKHKRSELLVKEKLKEKLKANEFQKVEKELKLGKLKSVTLDKVIASGGLCHTKEELDQLFKEGSVEDLRAQIRFRKLFFKTANLKVTGSANMLYNRLLQHINMESNSSRDENEEDDMDVYDQSD